MISVKIPVGEAVKELTQAQLQAMTRAQLAQYARERGISGFKAYATKPNMIQAILMNQ